MLSLRENFSWTLIGNLIFAGSQWGILVSMAKLGTPTMVGQYSLGLALTSPLFMLANLQLRQFQATDANDQFSFSHFLGLRLLTSISSLVLILAILLIGDYSLVTSVVILLLGLEKAARSISDILFGRFQKLERMDLIGISLLVKGPLSLLFMAVILWATGNIVLGIAGLIVSWLIIFILYDLKKIRFFHKLKPDFDFRILWKLFRLSLPLGIVMMLVSLNENIPRLFVKYFLGTDSLGYFSALAYIMIAGNTFVNALGQSVSPRLSRCYADGRKKGFISLIIKLVLAVVSISFVASLIAYLWGEEILTILYEPSYGNYAHIFFLLMICAGINYIKSILGYGLTAARILRIQPFLTAIAVVAGVLSCLFLIPGYGLAGAAYAMILAKFTQLLGYFLTTLNAVRKMP